MAVNPYTEYLQRLDRTLFTDMEGQEDEFYRRIIGLCTLCVYGMLIALVYVAVLVPQYRTRTSSNGQYLSSRRFWCARRVDPGYVTMNLHFLLPLGGFLSCACMLVYTYSEYQVMRWHKFDLLGTVNSYRSFLWISITMHGYLVTCASVQAYVAVTAKSAHLQAELEGRGRKRWIKLPGPRLFNSMFYVLTFLQLGAMLGSDIAFAINWKSLWGSIVNLHSTLLTAEAKWSPNAPPDVAMLLNLNSLQSTVVAKAVANRPYQRAVVLVLVIVAFIIALLNIGSGALYLLIRRQIRRAIARQSQTLFTSNNPGASFGQSVQLGNEQSDHASTALPIHVHFSNSEHSVPDRLRTTIPASSPLEEKDDMDMRPPTLGRKFSLASLSPVWRHSSDTTLSYQHSLGGEVPGKGAGEDPTTGSTRMIYSPVSPSVPVDLGGNDNLTDLQRAEGDLIICVVVVVSMALIFAGENIWNYVHVLPNTISWYETELSYFFVAWVYCLVWGVGCSFLVLNTVVANRRRSRNRSADVVRVQQGSNSSTESSSGVDRWRQGSIAVTVAREVRMEVDHGIDRLESPYEADEQQMRQHHPLR